MAFTVMMFMKLTIAPQQYVETYTKFKLNISRNMENTAEFQLCP
jgi:hypothetical protein